MPSAGSHPLPRPQIPAAHEVLTPETFGQVALSAASEPGDWLVLTALRADGRSTGDLVVAPLSPLPQRQAQLTVQTLYLAAAATDWTHLAYAVVEQHPEGRVALVTIVPIFQRRT